MLETGTGSGSLTSAMARSVLPSGHIHTYEFHAERAQKARDDFALLGIGGRAQPRAVKPFSCRPLFFIRDDLFKVERPAGE